MATRPMSEKAAEILFNRYMLQSFGLGGAQLFAPSSIEEFKNGYDAKIVGFSPLREIYLQFKAPDFLERNQRFTIRTTPHQHALLKSYPARAAYYVSAMFHSMEQMNQAQAILKTAEDFLKDFVCVEVSCLPPDVRSIHYSRPENHRSSPNVGFKNSQNGKSSNDVQPIIGNSWERGNTLMSKFKTGKLGNVVDLNSADVKHQIAPALEQADDAERYLTKFSEADFGVFIRIPA